MDSVTDLKKLKVIGDAGSGGNIGSGGAEGGDGDIGGAAVKSRTAN